MEVKSNVEETKRKWVYNPGQKCQCKNRTRYVQPEVPVSYKPNLVYTADKTPVACDTIYKNSYKTFDLMDLHNCKGKPILPKDSLVSAGDFKSDTTNKMSYGPWEGYKRQPQILPKDHCLMGAGPIQDMTTTRHDYTPKPIDQVSKIKHPGCLGLSDKPMENRTTNNLSYLWPHTFEPAISFKPEKRYLEPDSKMSSDTIQKLSFQPWEYVKKEIYPWQEKNKYKAPKTPMCGETIYNNSFFAPGRFVQDPSCENCYCVYEGECFDSQGNPPKAHEYNICPIGYDPIKDGPRTPLQAN